MEPSAKSAVVGFIVFALVAGLTIGALLLTLSF